MAGHLRFESVAAFTLADFADIFTHTFEGYWYPGTMSVPKLAGRARIEQLDFERSLVMLLDDEPVGQALLGLRGTEAWCGGFGIAQAARGRGLARPLGEAMLEQVRLAGAARFSLEVLTRNTPAIRVYTGLGLTIERDVQVFEWTAGDAGRPPREPAQDAFVSRTARQLLQHFDASHPVGAAWQRDLPALLVRSGLQGLAHTNRQGRVAYALYSVADSAARIEDLGAPSVDDAAALLRELQTRYTRLLSFNEPSDSPITASYTACGFKEIDRQHQMARVL